MTDTKHAKQTTSSPPARRSGFPRPKRKQKAAAPLPDDLKDLDPDALHRGDVPMDMVGHLGELRTRIITVVVTLAVCVAGCFILSDEILAFITRPFTTTGLRLHVFSVTEGFIIRMKAAIITGVVVALPVIVYQAWRYILPAIDVRDRRFARLSIVAALALFFAGTLFAFYVVLPASIRFLLSITPTSMQNVQNADVYIGFVLMFCVGASALFEFPLVVLILAKIGIVTPQFLAAKRRFAIILIFVGAAVFTPPDILTQLFIALPLIVLYELAIIISRFVIIRKKKRELQRA